MSSVSHHRVAALLSHIQPNLASSACPMPPPPLIYDCLVVGVGSMGSAACYYLSKRGRSVLGLERLTLGNEHSSHHGETRIIRLAYFEHPSYVPLLQRAYQLWRDLESDSGGEKILHITGGLDIGPRESTQIAGALRSCRENGIPHEILSAGEIERRFPAWKLPGDYIGIYQPDAGILEPEKSVRLFGSMARKYGAEIKENVEIKRVRRVKVKINGKEEHIVEAVDSAGKVYKGRQIILSAGAWTSSLLNHSFSSSELSLAAKYFPSSEASILPYFSHILRPERNVVAWYDTPTPASQFNFALGNFPIFLLDWENRDFYYGFPLFGSQPGMKIGLYSHRKEVYTEEQLNNPATRPALDAEDERCTSSVVSRVFPSLDSSKSLKMSSCIFTNTPDDHFVIDRPEPTEFPELILVSACSGHGMKMSSVIGEILADLVTEGRSQFDLEWLSVQRFLRNLPPPPLASSPNLPRFPTINP